MGGPKSGMKKDPTKDHKRQPMDKDRKPFERQTWETDVAWATFKIYRDIPTATRTMDAARIVCKKKPAYSSKMYQWSAKHWWPERTSEWDRELDNREREARLEAVADMKKRHTKSARKMQEFGDLLLESLLDDARIQLAEATTKAKKKKVLTRLAVSLGVKPKDLKEMIDTGQKLERLNLDEPGEIVETRSGPAELNKAKEQIAALLKRAVDRK
jgi:hypothetical protein